MSRGEWIAEAVVSNRSFRDDNSDKLAAHFLPFFFRGDAMSTDGKSEKRYDRHWQVIVSDLVSALQAGGYGSTLHEAIKRRRLDGRVLWISLECSGCGPFSGSADDLTVDQLEQVPKQPAIRCPRCGSDSGHIYKGLRTK
jgi:hypothetical protein